MPTSPRARDLAGRALRKGARTLDKLQARAAAGDGAAPAAAAPSADRRHEARVAANNERSRRRYAALYEQLRSYSGAGEPYVDAQGELRAPDRDRAREARRFAAALGGKARLVDHLSAGEGLDAAVVASVREMIAMRQGRVARSMVHAFAARGELPVATSVSLGLLAVADTMPREAWARFGDAGTGAAFRLAPVEFVTAGVRAEPAAAVSAVRAALDDGATASAADLLDVARLLFVADEALSRRVLDLVEPSQVADDTERAELQAGIEWLGRWYGAREAARTPLPDPAPAIPFAVIDYKQPDRLLASRNLGDHVQTIASLGHVVRRSGIRFSGDPDLVGVAEGLRRRVKPERQVDGDDAEFALQRIDRDATNWFALPRGTWALVFGWYMHPSFKVRYDVPLNPQLRPILVSVHVNRFEILTDEVLEQFRRFGPVGCRDWNTVAVLRSAGVPAFFSGCITTTIDTVFPPTPGATPDAGTLFVDTPADGEGSEWEQVFPEVRDRPFAANVQDALGRVGDYRDRYERVVTSRLHCYLPARSIGANVEFRPKNPSDVRFDGLAGIDDAAYDAIRDGILHKLDQVLGAIAAGRSEDDVYALWRELCAPDVAAADARLTVTDPIPAPALDPAVVCPRILANAVTIERSAPPRDADGAEIAVELSLDAHYRRQLLVMLDSISRFTARPVRVHVLCRGIDRADFADIAALFPTLSFVWLPTDGIDYGPAIAYIPHLTIATMDRLLVSELVAGDRLIHLDLDAVCLGDLAELADLDLAGARLAARSSPQQTNRSGFGAIIRETKRLREDHELARELIMRTHDRHAFDYPWFNAGVMVLDLARMRREDFCREFLPYAERFGLDDQDVLNVYAGGERAELDPEWNRFPRLEDAPAPKFVHWAGSAKPWHGTWVRHREVWDAAVARLAETQAAAGR